MKDKKERKLAWRRLDNSAKIFPIAAGRKYSTVDVYKRQEQYVY